MIIKVDPAKVQAQKKAARIAELKQLLADSDYKVLADYDKPVPVDLLAQRQAWRDEIRELEA
jgi:ribosomal protein L10